MLLLEEGYSHTMLAEEFGCGKSYISKWMKIYLEHGKAGLLHPSTMFFVRLPGAPHLSAAIAFQYSRSAGHQIRLTGYFSNPV
jgi:transposase-like protein